MALRHLLYLRCVLFLTLLLAVLHSPAPRISQWVSLLVLLLYIGFHFGLVWGMHRQKIPPDWCLYASLLDIGVISLMIYTASGIDVNLYIAYFVTIIGALLMENLIFSFIIAGIACSFYGLTIFFEPEAFSKPENLLPFAMLTVSSFFITFLSGLIHDKRRAQEEAEKKQALWREHLAASRRLFTEIQHTVSQPLERISTVAQGLSGKSKDDILWEIDGIRGQFKRLGDVFGQEKISLSLMKLEEALERAIFRLGPAVHEENYEIDIADLPSLRIAASKEHLASFFYGLFKESMAAMPAGGKIAMTTVVAPAQWWEINEKVQAWLRIEVAGTPRLDSGKGGGKPGPCDEGLGGVEWILHSHDGRFDETTPPGTAAPRYVVSLPINELPGV